MLTVPPFDGELSVGAFGGKALKVAIAPAAPVKCVVLPKVRTLVSAAELEVVVP